MMSVIMLSVIMLCHYAERHYAERHYAECHYAECYYAECLMRDGNAKFMKRHILKLDFLFVCQHYFLIKTGI